MRYIILAGLLILSTGCSVNFVHINDAAVQIDDHAVSFSSDTVESNVK